MKVYKPTRYESHYDGFRHVRLSTPSFAIMWSRVITLCLCAVSASAADEFREEIFIKPLPPTHLYTYFQFVTLSDDVRPFQHSYLLPRSLGEVISRFRIEEFHLSLTEGLWRHDRWGYPIVDAPPGAELYAWFSHDVEDVDGEWRKLSETLSGLFCASLNFIKAANTVSPKMALRPTGPWESDRNVTTRLRYATLPREIVCTENLTPWKKLLPCESSRGFASLLNSRTIHNTNYHSLGVHFRSKCINKDCTSTQYEVKQTVSLVYDYLLINSADWSIRRLFGRGLEGACPLAESSKIYIDITSNDTMPFSLSPAPDSVVVSTRGGFETRLALYNVAKARSPQTPMTNIAAKHKDPDVVIVPVAPPLHFNRYISGYGKEFGGVVTELTNTHFAPIHVVLLENAPWWLPIMLSTLRVNGEAKSELVVSEYFSPGRMRAKPHHLELLLKLPPRSRTTVSINFEYVYLKWQEYPPDANHAFYVGSAVVTALLPTGKNYTGIPLHGSTVDSVVNATQPWYVAVLRTGGVAVSLPTPDFSMPYNVICLTCTVVALAFGPLFNICTKKLIIKLEQTKLSLLKKMLNVFKKKKD